MDLILDNSFSFLKGNYHELDLVQEFLSYKVKNYVTKAYYNRTALIRNTKTEAVIWTGMYRDIVDFSKQKGIHINLIDKRVDPVLSPAMPHLKDIELFPYQTEAIQAFLKAKRGVLKLPTGSGKTITAIAIFKSLGVPTLWITHRTSLVRQVADSFVSVMPEIAQQIGIIGDGIYEPKFLTIATTQSIYSLLKRDEEATKKLLSQYKFLIIDEAHRMKSKSFCDTAKHCNNAYYRLALTATPFMRNDPEENFSLKGVAGNIFYEVYPEKLIDMGLLAQPLFKYIKVSADKVGGKEWHDIYNKGIVNNVVRNNLIINAAKQLREMGKKPLIIANALEHCDNLKAGTQKIGLNFQVVTGKHDTDTRAYALDCLSDGSIDGIICTGIFDEGINVTDINAIVLAGGGRSVPMLYQRVGRATRKKEENNYAIIVDFIDAHSFVLNKHSMLRKRIVEQQKGFRII